MGIVSHNNIFTADTVVKSRASTTPKLKANDNQSEACMMIFLYRFFIRSLAGTTRVSRMP